MTTNLSRRSLIAGSATVMGLSLAACGGGSDSGSSGASDGKAELTLSGWSLDSTPEFQALVDAFQSANPNVTISLKEYSATDYDTQLTTDLSGGSAPDIMTMKNLQKYYFYASNSQLLDVSDLAKEYDGDKNIDVATLAIDGTTYALPYRQDSWLLYYNKALLDKAGVPVPDGSWTWEDFAANAKTITDTLGDGTKGSYIHTWQSIVQSTALVQTPDADLTSGDFSYMKPYYDIFLQVQEDGATVDFATAQAQSMTYQAEFGTEKAALLPMGSWYIATLLQQQESGDAHDFEWGIAPLPQRQKGDPNITFGTPTAFAVNANIDDAKKDAAQKFLTWASGEEGAKVIAGLGVTPAYSSDAVVDAIFGLDGMPSDEGSKTAFSTHETGLETPVSEVTADVQDILKDTHSEIMTGASTVDDGLKKAEDRVANEGLVAK